MRRYPALCNIGFASTLLFLNESRAPFNVKEFRQAVDKAINT